MDNDDIQNNINILSDYYSNYCENQECETCKYDEYFSCRIAFLIDNLIKGGIDCENIFKSK